MKDPNPQLVDAVARLDDSACSDLIRRYGGLVRAAVRQRGYFFPDHRDEEELQSKVQLAMIRSIAKWDPARASFSTWVYGVARNVVNSFFRDQERRVAAGRAGLEVRLEVPGEVFDPPGLIEDEVETSPRLAAFYEVYERTSSEGKLVIEHMMRGDPHWELAQTLRITEDAAKMRVLRMKQGLREALRDKV